VTTDLPEGIAILEAPTCWQLLGQEEVGRLAVSVGRYPEIFPVNYVVDQRTVIFRTAEGTKLFATVVSPSVAFEVDGYDPEAGEAWSVVIKGHAREIPMYDLPDDTFPLFPWTATPKPRFVRVVPDAISGRRFHVLQRRPRSTD
jgi:uncharacterized protein